MALQQAGVRERAAWDCLNTAQARATSEQLAEMLRAQQNAYRPASPRAPFDGGEVIDLVQGADGAWHVPPDLEYRMGQP